MAAGLQINRLIGVTLNISPTGASYASVTSCMLIGTTDVIDTSERYRTYSDIDDVADDFGTTDPEYIAADIFFSQDPTPESLMIGRWAYEATSGSLVCGILSDTNQEISTWNDIDDGAFYVSIDSGDSTLVSNLDFSSVTVMSGVASVISSGLTNAGLDATCTWDADHFIIKSESTGTSSNVSALTASEVSGTTDIADLMYGTSSKLDHRVSGIAAEGIVDAIGALEDATSFYMVHTATEDVTDDDHLLAAAYIEAEDTPHFYGITTQNTAALSSASTSDIGYAIRQLEYQRTRYQYSSSTPYAFVSAFGRLATVDFTESDSAITLMYKTEPGVTGEDLSTSQANALDSKGYVYYANFNNDEAIIVDSSGDDDNLYVDDIQGCDWIVTDVQTDVFNALYSTTTKIPQTDAGNTTIVTTIKSSMYSNYTNGLLGAGDWNHDGFGSLSDGDYLENGYYVYATPVADQSTTNRANRKATVKVAAIFAGAVHKVDITINVQR